MNFQNTPNHLCFHLSSQRKVTYLKSLSFVFFRYKHLDLEGASTWIFASSGEQFTFSEIQIKGNAHLGFMPSGSYGDAASVFAGSVVGDKTGTFVFVIWIAFLFGFIELADSAGSAGGYNNYTCQ